MKSISSLRLLPALIAGVCLASPATSEARKIEVRVDRDHDGHYNTKTIDFGRRGYGGNSYDHGRYYGNRYYDNRNYGGRYGYGYGRPYHYGSSYYSPYYYGPSLGVSYYSRPSYYSRTYTTYDRGYGYGDDLAVDVQRALKRRGYYRGSLDGDIGPGSRSAIRAYQADRGLPITGRIDSRLLRALGIG